MWPKAKWRASAVNMEGRTEGTRLALARTAKLEGSGRSDDEQCLSLFCAMLCCAGVCFELLCALSVGIVEEEGKSSYHEVVVGSRAVVVHVCDGGVGLGVLREANKAETTAATGVTVLDDDLGMSVIVARLEVLEKTYGLLDLTELLALLAKGLVIGVPSRPPPSLVCHARPPRRPC
jgi:hypothetical protein